MYLTKSKFKEGLICPIRLTNRFIDEHEEDPFLLSLADGGFQVEALSRLHYKGGVFIKENNNEAIQKTNKYLKKEEAIIYEAAFKYENLFIRTDIFVQSKNSIKIIEVKAKSFDSRINDFFFKKRGGIEPTWIPYLFDLSFQKYVLENIFPEKEIKACFMLADKAKKSSIDGLNQLFQINGFDGETVINAKVDSIKKVGDSILEEVEVTDIINDIIHNNIYKVHGLKFLELIEEFSNLYTNKDDLNWGKFNNHICKDCWTDQFEIDDSEKNRPNIYELWVFSKKKKFITNGIYFLDQLNKKDFSDRSSKKITVQHRQWLQIEGRVNEYEGKPTCSYIDRKNLKNEIMSWTFPLHFIDFETSASALPFTKGRHPYESVAFQFSHHLLNQDGKIEHKSEYINTIPGEFPNFKFIRELKKSVGDSGTIFRYSHHENTILNSIHDQLIDSNETDKIDLINFIKTITIRKNERRNVIWEGERNMIDLCDIVVKYFYHPLMRGSNSIKKVLPTIIEICDFLKSKYSKEIGKINITSLNFSKNHRFISNNLLDPYESLPNIDFSSVQNPLCKIEKLNNGGEALIAYAKMQYMDMSEPERKIISQSLLKYCELDTLAMVMIYEFFIYELKMHKFLK